MRRLSNMEWATLLYEIDVTTLDLPPHGGVIEWGGMDVLVYVGPTGEVFLTDVTGEDELIQQIGRTYNPYEEYWWYHLPEATTQILWERAEDANAIVQTAITAASQPYTYAVFIVAIAALGFFYLKGKTT